MVIESFIYLFVVILLSVQLRCNAQEKENCVYELGYGVVEELPSFNNRVIEDVVDSFLIYPINAQIKGVEGIVFVTISVDLLGRTTNHKVIKGIREDLDKEALRVARLIKFDKPAMQRGKPITVQYTVPVEFSLQNKNNKEQKVKKRKW